MNKAEKRSSRTIFFMIAATLVSKVLGMIRSMMTAWILGDSAEAVAFAAASKIPGAIFDFLFSAAILGCFIPMYNYVKEKSEKDADRYSSSFITAVMAVCAVLSVLGIVFSRAIIKLAAPKISEEAAKLAAELLRIMFPMMILTAGAYTLTGILQSAGKFILPAMISAVSNAFMIFYLVIFKNSFSVYIFALVYTFSWLLQFLTLAIPLAVKKKLPKPTLDIKNDNLINSAKRIPNIMAGSWLVPASILMASFFSSFVSETAFVAYDYANNVYSIISGVAVYGVGNFIFPALSRFAAKNDESSFSTSVKKAVFMIMFIILPVFAATFSLSDEIIRFLYLRGNFTEELAVECARALRFLSFAMPFLAASEIFSRTFYAQGKTRPPMYATLIAIVAATIADIVLVIGFKGGLAGISVSFAVAQIVQAIVLLIFAYRKIPGIFKKISVSNVLHLASAFVLSLITMTLLEKNIGIFTGLNLSLAIFLKISIVFITGVVIYLLYIFVIKTISSKLGEKGAKKIDRKETD